MNRRLKYFFATIVVSYISLYCISHQLANFVLAVFLVLLVPILVTGYFLMNYFYKSSIKIVSKQFVANSNTIRNDHCTVSYTPDARIIVMDNIADRTHAKRMFTLQQGSLNINKAWNRVCRIFDSFITLDSLAAFYSYDTKIEIKVLEAKVPPRPVKQKVSRERINEGPKVIELDSIRPDPYMQGMNASNDANVDYVNIDNIQEQKTFVPREEKAPEFSGLDELMHNSPNKINVNTVTSSELSILPGINIVGAKKIIEYRDMNGYFETVEDFLKVANVKPHFEEKIKNMISVEIPQEQDDNDDTFEGRIIDF